MSLLSDLLSRIKYVEHTKDVPPGLKSIVSRANKKWIMRRQIFFISLFFAVAIISGFVIAHFVQTYSKTPLTQSTKDTGYRIQDTEKVPFQIVEVKGKNLPPVIEEQKPGEGIQEQLKSRETAQLSSGFSASSQEAESAKHHEAGSEFYAEFQSKFKDTKSDSSEKEIYLYLANDYELKKDYNAALSNYKKALKTDPKDYRVMNKIGSILLELRLFKEALIYLQDAINIKNDYIPALINMGVAYAKLNNLSQAEIYLSTATALEPYNKHAIFNIALLYEEMDNYDKAQKYYSMLKDMGDVQGNAGLIRIKEKLKATNY